MFGKQFQVICYVYCLKYHYFKLVWFLGMWELLKPWWRLVYYLLRTWTQLAKFKALPIQGSVYTNVKRSHRDCIIYKHSYKMCFREIPKPSISHLPCQRWQTGALDPSSLAPTQDFIERWLWPSEGHPLCCTDYSRAAVVPRPTAGAAPPWFCSFLITAQTARPLSARSALWLWVLFLKLSPVS